MRSRNLFSALLLFSLKNPSDINNGPLSDLEKWLTSETLEATIRKNIQLLITRQLHLAPVTIPDRYASYWSPLRLSCHNSKTN